MPNTILIPTLDNLEAFLAQHREIYGPARMQDDTGAAGDGGGDAAADDSADQGAANDAGDPPAGDSADLIEERNARKAAETILSEMLPGKSKAEIRRALKNGALDSLRTPAKDATADQPDADQIRRDAEQAATEKANGRIVSAEVRALAAELFADPSDAPLYLDLSAYDVDDDGSVDAKQITSDLKALLVKKPHLAKAAARPKPDRSQGHTGGSETDAQPGMGRMRAAYASSSTT